MLTDRTLRRATLAACVAATAVASLSLTASAASGPAALTQGVPANMSHLAPSDENADGDRTLDIAEAGPFNIFKRFGGGGGGGGADGNKKALLAAYPGAFRIEGNTVIFPDGERIVWDDGRRKSPQALLDDADVEDMFHYPYPAGAPVSAPARNADPGRVRSDAFFKALYGASSGAVQASLRSVPWVPKLGGGRLLVTTRFGVDERLEAVSRELEQLPPRFHKYLVPSAGTFNWRTIAGTNRQSVHSFGAAIDINTKFTNYWRWDAQKAGGTIPYRNQIPLEIVSVFEKYCFVWGGRWYHYDTMHFEYRPELLPHCR